MQDLNNLPLISKVILVVMGLIFYGTGIATNSLSNLLNPPHPPLSQLTEVSLIARNKLTQKPIPSVDIQFSGKGAPSPQQTDVNGYARVKIPITELINITYDHPGFDNGQQNIDLRVNPDTNIILYMTPKSPQNQESKVSPPTSSLYNHQEKSAVISNGGWWAEYYLGDFADYRSSGEFPDQQAWGFLGKDWGWKSWPPEFRSRPPKFSIRFVAERELKPGRYRFFVNADDHSRVKVNGQEIISAWEEGGEKNGTFESKGGKYKIQVDYKDNGGAAAITLRWEKES